MTRFLRLPRLPRHPDTIPDLEPDTRRVLREEYQRIQVSADRGHLVTRWTEDRLDKHGNVRETGGRVLCQRTDDEVRRDVAQAVAEYRRVAAMWGVDP